MIYIYTHGGVFPVRRGRRDERSFEIVHAILGRDGTVCVYCEGGRSRTGRLAETAKPGIGRMALETGAPIVPVGIAGSQAVRNWKRLRLPARDGEVRRADALGAGRRADARAAAGGRRRDLRRDQAPARVDQRLTISQSARDLVGRVGVDGVVPRPAARRGRSRRRRPGSCRRPRRPGPCRRRGPRRSGRCRRRRRARRCRGRRTGGRCPRCRGRCRCRRVRAARRRRGRRAGCRRRSRRRRSRCRRWPNSSSLPSAPKIESLPSVPFSTSFPGVPAITFVVGGASVEGSGGTWMTVSQLVRTSRSGAVSST